MMSSFLAVIGGSHMRGPVLLGQPSLALRKMKYLTPDELRDYIARLQLEKDRVTARLAARQKAGVTSPHDMAATRLERRLEALTEQARRYWAAQGGGGQGGDEDLREAQDGNTRGGNDVPRPAQGETSRGGDEAPRATQGGGNETEPAEFVHGCFP
jgi:hypothetical protein